MLTWSMSIPSRSATQERISPAMGPIFGAVKNKRGIHIHDAKSGVLQLFDGEVEKDGGVGVFPARIARREEAADVAGGHGAQQRVGDGVQQHVAIGVTGKALGMVQCHAADAQRYARLECVRVPAKSDSCIHDLRACLFADPAGISELRWRR